MSDIDVESLLSPKGEQQPCGEDLTYDPQFLALEECAKGRPEQQFGDTVIAAEDPDWQAMRQQALELLVRTCDLRVAVSLLRAQARLKGLAGVNDALWLLNAMLTRYWGELHPMLEDEGGGHRDATMRMNALVPLTMNDGFIADLRAASIDGRRGGLTVRQIELAARVAEPHGDELAPTEEGIVAALSGDDATKVVLREQLATLQRSLSSIDAILQEQVGSAAAPDLAPLARIARGMADLARKAAGTGGPGEDEASETQADAGGLAGRVAPRSAGLDSRERVIKSLDDACDWIARHEPTNPAPLLIRRAQRLMGKSFIEIVRDMAPDGLKDVERIAGVDSD